MKIHKLVCLGLGSLLLATGLIAGELGTLDFANSGAAEAQEDFINGVLLLHSFEFEDAREAFQRARELDPDFAMAYWGEAMTHNHPLWRHKGSEAALEILAEYAPTAAERASKAPTPRERAYLETLDVLYGAGDKIEQDTAYEAAMERLVRTYPEDLEARAFYALSILGTTQGTRDFRAYMRAAAEAEVVFAANPQHPGAAHYLIHSYDDPVHAPLGLRPASVYASIAPAATHAQHMISHIYIALGMWAEAGIANEKSLAVSEERAARKGLPEHKRSHHALHWLQYSYLQEGRVKAANRLLEIMASDEETSGTEQSAWYLAQMRAGQLVETGEWGRPIPPEADGEGGGVTRIAADRLVSTLQAIEADQLDQAKAAGNRLQETLRGRREHGPEGRETEEDLKAAEVTMLEIEALVAWHGGNPKAAVEILERAAAIEDSLPPEFGPPIIVQPSHELFGLLLLELDEPKRARQEFEAALRLAPRRVRSLQGLSTSARLMGDAVLAGQAASELVSIRQKGLHNELEDTVAEDLEGGSSE